MAGDQARLELSMAAEPVSVRLLRSEIRRWLEDQGVRDDGLVASIALATSEAVTNVVRHAYGDRTGRVEIDALLGEDEVRIDVRDAGAGLTARTDTEHAGLGLPVIGRVSTGVSVASDAGGTTVSMRFEVPRRAGRARRLRSRLDPTHAVGLR